MKENQIVNEIPEAAEFENEVERVLEPDVEDVLWFGLKKGEDSFRIGLSDILMCLKFAEQQGEIPELPHMWWIRVSAMYPKLDAFRLG